LDTFPLGTGTIYDLYSNPPRPPALIPAGVADDVSIGLANCLAVVRELHSRLVVSDSHGNPTDLKYPETWSIVGIGVETDTSVVVKDGQIDRQSGPCGDGTSPFPSGSGLFPCVAAPFHPTVDLATNRQFVVSGVEHSAALGDANVIECIQGIPRCTALDPKDKASLS
jgi:hypothetical protein